MVCAGVGLLLLLTGCAEDESPEQQIRDTVDAAADAVERRALTEVKALISPGYQDREQRSRRDLTQLLAGYFFRHKSIHLLTQINRIRFPQPEQAEVLLFVAMAGRPIEDVAQLTAFRARLYRIDLQMVREDGEWLVNSGRWRPADSSDFFE